MAQLRKAVGDLLERKVDMPKPTEAAFLELAAVQSAVFENKDAGHSADALAGVERWLQLDPFDAVAHLTRGQLLLGARDHGAALRSFEAAALDDRELYAAQAGVAALYEMLGFLRKAVEAWGFAARAAPSDRERAGALNRVTQLREVA